MNRTMQTQQQIMQENDAAALAADMFDHFCSATTIRSILGIYRTMCDTINLRPGPLNEFYPKLKAKVKNWKAQALWKKFDARAAHRVYNKGTACNGVRVFVIGAGPCGLRTAIEAQLLGAKVVVVEKRDRISRNNVLHLWPFLITDLRNLGAKKFYGKFCAGAIDHISIRQLQCILLKVALLLGVEVHEGVSFIKTLEPTDGCGWRALVSPDDHAVSHYEFDVLMGADGKRNTLEGFRRKEFRGKLAIAITANFINKKTEAEARVEEISGVAFIFNQSFFKELYKTTGIDLENIVYYKDETHYFVMTAKKHSLLDKGVIIQDYADPAELLKPSNVNTERLSDYAREAAAFSTKYQMPNLEFAVNHYGKPDVAMFDFTSMFAAENSSRISVRKNYRLLQCLVGDSLLEPFWPTGSGCARGFLSSMDAAYAVKLFASHSNSSLAVLAQRESIYRLLAQTTPENLHRDIGAYTIDPATRYPNLNRFAVSAYQVKQLLDTDDPSLLEQTFMDTNTVPAIVDQPIRRKRRTGDTIPLGTVLLRWIKSQLKGHDFAQNLNEVAQCFTNGEVLCSLINRYRPDLIDLNITQTLKTEELLEKSFSILEQELGIPRVISTKEAIHIDTVEQKIWLNYLEQICEVFRGEIPHVKHPKLDFDDLKEKPRVINAPADFSRLLKLTSSKKTEVTPIPPPRRSHAEDRDARRSRKANDSNLQAIGSNNDVPRRAKKRRTYDKTQNIEERTKRLEEIEANRTDRHTKRREQRRKQTENFLTSLHMLQANTYLLEHDRDEAFDDYSLYVYRQSAPIFNDRVKELEKKLLYPDRERGIQSAMPRGGPDDIFSNRIKSMEQQITGKNSGITEKKPKDLLRAIGKIESNDWNVKEIEKKIEQSKKTEVGKNRERVPKWSREQFLARQNKMSRPLEKQGSTDERFKEIDTTLKELDKQLKDPVLYESRKQSKNKVASIAGQLQKKDDIPNANVEEKERSKDKNKVNLVLTQGASEVCHFCKQRVYLMEKITPEGLVLHRSCLKCHHCHTNLRLGGYAFDRDNPQGFFYCTQHYRLPAKARPNLKRPQSNQKRTEIDGQILSETPSMITEPRKSEISRIDLLNRGQTPERIEFENADMSDGEPSLDNVIDENEWTDRNFGTGTDASESDITSSTSESEESDSDIFEEAMGSPLGAQTLQLATDWIGKQRYIQDSDEDEFYDTSEDEEADTQTEGEELAKARELRMQEVKLRPPLATTTDTETEAPSDSDTSSPDDKLDSATEISTDSEFDHDPISKIPPTILINSRPTKVQVKQSVIGNGYGTHRNTVTTHNKDRDIHLTFKPLVQVDPTVLNSNIAPLKNPRPGDYLLNKTQSTEIIASKKSLELKKRYLLGEPNPTGGIMKSGSTSVLDSKFRNFHSNISECQKLLNPAANSPSPIMQSFLKNSKIGESKKNNNNDEKENIVNGIKLANENNQISDKLEKLNTLNETINTTLVENKLKDFNNRSKIETIDLTASTPEQKKSTPIIDLNKINIPNSVIKKNQEFIDNLGKADVIDLTYDTPVKDRSLEEQNENFAAIPDIIKSNLSERAKCTIDQMFDEKSKSTTEIYESDLDQRPRSPAHEKTIQVPTLVSWDNNKRNIDSDSLSSSTSSLGEIPHYILDSATSPETQCGEKFVPRVEIHNTTGELMQIDSLMIIDGKYVGDPDDLKLMEKLPAGTVVAANNSNNSDKNIEQKIDENCDINSKSSVEKIFKYDYKKPDLKFDTKNENKIDTLRNIPLIIPKDKPKNLKFAETVNKNDDLDKTPTVANPEPIKIQQILTLERDHPNSDSETEVTCQVLTETELSDWTADDAVSENFVDIEFALNSNKGTIKRNKKSKQKVKSQTNSIAQAQTNHLGQHFDFDNIEFMDTGSEDSCIETYSTTNKAMLKNHGYVEFVDNDQTKDTYSYKTDLGYVSNPAARYFSSPNNKQIIEAINKDMPKIEFIEQGACILSNDFDLKTPMNETPKTLLGTQSDSTIDSKNEIEEDSLIMIASQTTTEDSDALTVVTSPLDSNPEPPSLSEIKLSSDDSPIDKKSTEIEKLLDKTVSPHNNNERRDSNITPDEMSYEEYVRKLQTKIREISSARDSLDMRKTRRKSSKGEDSSLNSQVNNTSSTPTKSLSVFATNKIQEPPTLTKKLEEITKERTKQKDLIHDLVMDKLQTKKQMNVEKRLNRSRNRNNIIFNSTGVQGISLNPNGDACESIHPIVPERNRNKLKQEPERRHSLHITPPPENKKEPENRTSNEIKTIIEPIKICKTNSFCVNTKYNPFSEFRTPITAPPTRIPVKTEIYSANTESIRQQARARARLKSNEDLGLSPDEKIQLLRKRYHLDLNNVATTPDPTKNKSDDMKFRERRLMTSKSVNDITTVHHLANELSKNFISGGGLTPQSQPQTPSYMKNFDFVSDTDLSKSKEKHFIKDSDRRKSIMQTVSSFFHKKKDSKDSSPSKDKESNKSELRFGLFKVSPKNKSKDKEIIPSERSKSENCLKYEKIIIDDDLDDIAPPVPPLPLNYERSDDENYENDFREMKKYRSISKASKQAELKRLRIAQEIQREQEEIEVKIKELEAKGVALEKELRGEDEDYSKRDPTQSVGCNDERLVQDLLDIWRNITDLKKRDEELSIRQKELQLEHRHAQLKEELNIRLSCNKLDKSSSDIAAEGAILNEMLEIVAKRAALRPTDTIANTKLNDDLNSDYSDLLTSGSIIWPLAWKQTYKPLDEQIFSNNLFLYSKNHRQTDFFKKPVFGCRFPQQTMSVRTNIDVIFLDQDNTSSLY